MTSLLRETIALKTPRAFTWLYIPPWTRETVHPAPVSIPIVTNSEQ